MALLIQCILLCAIFTLLILPPQFKNPLSQIVSYPPAIRARVESLPQYREILKGTRKRNIARKIIGTLIAIILLAFLAFFSGKTTFASVFIHVFVLCLAVNVYDLVVLDLMVFAHSKRVVIPGTEDMVKDYRNPVHHIKGACKGVAISLIAAALSAGLVEIIGALIP